MDWKTQKPLEELKLLYLMILMCLTVLLYLTMLMYLMILLYLPMMPDDVDLPDDADVHDYFFFIPVSVIVPGSVFLRPSAPIITSNSS